jgi:predicted ferric reductase
MVLMDKELEKTPLAIGPALVYASVGVAILLWLLAAPIAARYTNTAATLKSIANIAAFSGAVLYAWSVFLSSRLLVFDSWFGGLDKAYKWHHYTGGMAFFLLTLHPLFLSIRALSQSANVSTFWLIGQNWQINFGIIPLYVLALFLPISIFLRVKYGLFIWLHRILGAVFFLGFLHAFMAHGNMAKFWPLWLYMFLVSAVAIAAFIYHSVLGALLPIRYRYKVDQVNNLGGGVTEIILAPATIRLLPFVAGQFAYVGFVSHPMGSEAHPFSMAYQPRTRNLRFVVKALGDYTAKMNEIKKGTTAYVEGPHGGFNFRTARKYRQVWVAGGIGVTPFLSMAEALPSRKYDVDFYYCVVTAKEACFEKEFKAVAKRNPAFKPKLFCQDKEGFIDANKLTKGVDVLNTDFYICGPPPMMHALHKGLLEKGVPNKRIHFEDFSMR